MDEEVDRRDSSSPLLEREDGHNVFHAQQPASPYWPPRKRTVIATIMAFFPLVFLLLGLSGWSFGNSNVPWSKLPKRPLIVTLPGYGSFKGTQILATYGSKTALRAPVDAWLGINYAKPPVEDLRFAQPKWPDAFNGTQDAVKFGPICIQNAGWNVQSEDCLNFNVFRTAGIPFSRKLPVFAYVHGGAFVMGNGRGFDGAAFVAQSQRPIMVVTFQYRLGALGSLPSKLFEEENLLNLGLLDQRLMLDFIQEYIGQFGGNPDEVTLGGQSAGAHSVGIHLFHNYRGDKGNPLFARAILSSGSPIARTFPEATYPIYERQFTQFMEYLSCPLTPNDKALECLRAAPTSDIQHISQTIYKASEYNITWPWQPVSPGPLLEKRGSDSGRDGSFFKVPIIISSTTDEGKLFAPKDLTTTEQFTAFMGNVNPGLTKDDLADLIDLYPDPENETSPYHNSPISTQFNRISAAYGDYSYICPVQDTADVMAKSKLKDRSPPVYKARFNTPNWAPDWQGVPHASDGAYFNGVPNVQYPDISTLYASYFASFVVSGDPNKYSIDSAPIWDRYEGTGGSELVVGSLEGLGTAIEIEGDVDTAGKQGIRMDACAWWRDPDRMDRLRK
ncbi:alpha/beta-hydrolase [Aaosphaeria arxii CBS 175.79]|uniref:Carboxylic ester hydrolase n=1 Tax=Aaosphaeria arxii CBS 175.79 TaxID=1450172 RepID=A0A6A5XR38_9PLEO|nr:alpha/beta-hydrolase [Aaosphaeria arxii CBS 175.79]KAF2015297.1 alpha/beta-hydrolase [Aaosphaeria arxii CBS 175.79]